MGKKKEEINNKGRGYRETVEVEDEKKNVNGELAKSR